MKKEKRIKDKTNRIKKRKNRIRMDKIRIKKTFEYEILKLNNELEVKNNESQ